MNLKKKDSPSSEVDKGLLLRQFHLVKLIQGNSPDNYITKMGGLRSDLADLGVFFEEDVFLHQILSSLGEDYLDLMQSLTLLVNNKNDPLTLEKLKNELDTCNIRRNLSVSKFPKKKFQKNVFFSYQKQFKGKCRNCGQQGHK